MKLTIKNLKTVEDKVIYFRIYMTCHVHKKFKNNNNSNYRQTVRQIRENIIDTIKKNKIKK